VNHHEAWTRLPDLLDDRDDPGLLAHVRGCAECQRQLFLLGRVERVLRVQAETRLPRRAPRGRFLAAAAAVAAVVAVAVLMSTLPLHDGRTNAFTLRTAAGRPVAKAMVGHSDARNVSLELVAQRLPLNRRHVFVLWAADDRASMEVGDFMVDATGGCRVSFNLPATHEWVRFWVAQPGNAAAVVAST
jgi:hypothetical protein